jgi:squalene synthase HpnC
VVRALVSGSPSTVDRAYAHCSRVARDHYENFPVASFLLPPPMRPAVAAVYAFARRADDFADEPGIADPHRLRLLDAWAGRLHQMDLHSAASDGDDLVFVALADAVRRHDLPLALFEDLLSAFRQDVLQKRYRTWGDVLDYCRRSANPIGRLVLRIAGYRREDLDRASDCVCTALQLTNFWQDLARDWAIGRLYVPIEERDGEGARDEDLDAGRMSAEWRAVLRKMAERTRALFDEGRPVCDGVRGRLRAELRITWLGGRRVLAKLERNDFDVFRHRPSLTAADVPLLAWRALAWR